MLKNKGARVIGKYLGLENSAFGGWMENLMKRYLFLDFQLPYIS